jgi:hypothetical protein
MIKKKNIFTYTILFIEFWATSSDKTSNQSKPLLGSLLQPVEH